ncbi:MAG: DUF5716 family protein [Lachnospiraceae bacterium]
MQLDETIYVGIDLNDSYTQISYYKKGMQEPLSLSPVNGSEQYMIPTAIAKKEGSGQWYCGKEALKSLPGLLVTKLFTRALINDSVPMEGEVFPVKELLLLFLRKVLLLATGIGFQKSRDQVVVTIQKQTKENVALLRSIMERLGVPEEQLKICSYQEAFAQFILSQEPTIWNHEVVLFDYWKEELLYTRLWIEPKKTPKLIQEEQEVIEDFVEFRKENTGITREEWNEKQDQILDAIVKRVFQGKIISAVYLVGTGFDGDWMRRSLEKIATGRRAFSGKNLYTKGACYYGTYTDANETQYLYLGEDQLPFHVCLKVREGKDYAYKVIIPAGVSWQDAKGVCEVILKGTAEFAVFLKELEGKRMFTQSFPLENLSQRPEKTSRLRIQIRAIEKEKFQVRVKDLGFGKLFPSSETVWEFEFELPGSNERSKKWES